ncbi:MAG TPA: hypothetical protein VF054_11705 [Micromonosporaceae bacterium]
MRVVHDLLTDSLNTPTVLVERTDLVTIPMSFDPGTGLLDVDGRRVRPVVVWTRHASACAMMAQARPGDGTRPLDAVSWSRFLTQVAAAATGALPGRTPVGAGQLVDAGQLGVAVPRTVVTTDVDAGVRYLAVPQAVVKTQDFRLFEPDRRNWSTYLPEIVDRDAAPSDRPASGRPVVVQEYVPHDRELRVYYLNGGICAFEIRKPEPSSLWTDPDSVTVTPVDCPAVAVEAVRTLCTAWGLRFGAFDLLARYTGEVVFLEANPDGDWLWFERRARWNGVSFMAAVMVRELFVRGTSLGAHVNDCDAA